MGFFKKQIGPVFMKDSSDETSFIEKMEKLKERATGELEQKIERQINLAKYGELGENNIAFELKNSGMDMYILHDIYLEIGDLSAQIDFIVITRKCVYIIESKNMIGNIQIDNTGAFIRSYELFGRKVDEGIYSPITQNLRHLQVLKEIGKASKTNILTKMFYEKRFDECYKSIVVLANPKTVLKAKYAKKEVRDQVIRADQLITFIKNTDSQIKDSMSNDAMLELAKFYLEQNKVERSDYAMKYQEMLEAVENTPKEEVEANVDEKEIPEPEILPNVDRESCTKDLKAFRLEQARKENIKPYYIFNDAQMNDLMDKAPKNKNELQKVSGFGSVKVEKYGDAILQIITNYFQ